MKRIKTKVLPILFSILMIVSCITPIYAQERGTLDITLASVENFDNNQDAMFNFSVVNTTNETLQANLIVGLYENNTNKMITYNYVNDEIKANSDKNWGTCIPIPADGEYKIKAFAWDNMHNPVTLSNTLIVNQHQEVISIDEKVDEAIKQAVKYQLDAVGEPGVATIGGDWTVFSLARSGLEIPEKYYETYYDKVVGRVKEESIKDKRRWDDKVTDVERVCLALSSIGKNPANVDGINLLDYIFNKAENFPEIKPDGELGHRQGVNELSFALLAIDAKDYKSETGITREKIINRILNDYQIKDGGFALSGDTLDVDTTAMTIQALAPYYDSNEDVKAAIDKAVDKLSKLQGSDGKYEISFVGSELTKPSETISQIIVALTSLGINPHTDSRFVKNDNSLITALLTYIDSTGGFKHVLDENVDGMATDQGLYALVAYDRLVEGKNTLYDMSDVDFSSVGTVQLSIEKRIIGKGDTVSRTSVDLYEKDNVFDVLKRLVDEKGLSMKCTYNDKYGSRYIVSIDGDGEFDHGNGSGWMYYVNGELPNVGVSAYFPEDGDVIRLRYTTNWGALEEPLVDVLKHKITEAEKYSKDDYTVGSFQVLEDAISDAKVITEDDSYNSTEDSKELIISAKIGELNKAIEGLVEDKNDKPVVAPDTIPEDFENDLWLNSNFRIMEVGDTYDLTARRVPEIIDDPISNRVAHPTYHYNVIKGDSVEIGATSDNGVNKIEAVSVGTSVIEVTYDATHQYNRDFGACSDVNKAYIVVDVTDGEDKGIDIKTSIDQRNYDTIYYAEGNTTDYTFDVDLTGSNDVKVLCNDNIIEPNDNKYTVSLENRSNIIEINATNENGTEKLFYVIDARKIEIDIENMSREDETIKAGDEVKVSFRGITLPVYKLATIYNPTFPSPWGNDDYTRVKYDNEILGEVKSNDNVGQYSLATANGIKITFDKEGVYDFTDGHIDESWWGSSLGSERDMTGPGEPNLGADVCSDTFSTLPDFSIVVEENDDILPTQIELDKNELSISTGDTENLYATILPDDAVDKSIIWESSDEKIATVVDGVITGISEGEATITVKSNVDNDITATCQVTVKDTGKKTDKTKLTQLIDEAEKLDKTSYTEKSYNGLLTVLDTAKDAVDKEDITQDEIDDIRLQLQSAIDDLEKEEDQEQGTGQDPISGIEITEKQLDQNDYDVFYYLADETYVIDGQEVTFVDGDTISYGAEEVGLRNKELSYSIDKGDDDIISAGEEIVIRFNGLSTPIGSVAGQWNSTYAGKLMITYNTDVEGLEVVQSENGNTDELKVLVPEGFVGEIGLTDGSIYEAANEWSPGIDGIGTSGNFGSLPDIQLIVE
ncbi:hypothetical protein SH1V18_04950 [Vallitalea longa]|uniref:BIG2 domain-containing protein n=1 Tax=Vallitalea longa TaxID=2936439 RepID=A0A9W5Y7B4_9FIRM|nr:DUF4430 domain-containing protein [Vallitalea longa]GKX28015.1 hypothetical protein SH1V18_04950 [Vallitalea longa]